MSQGVYNMHTVNKSEKDKAGELRLRSTEQSRKAGESALRYNARLQMKDIEA